ncbi:(2Fe-2S) ferredoxin domain-containing protein [Aetokthonos hydrillicola Thurmond2011]|jgi:(2Fe-2S) ferredoxin|uniref:(2Fe-2S) ferredoxin domain-containing protein n=1 Tax=Aetokthonos hydrillicola Thurmond2011 TaxID=2712845 RepID=A0AAP5M9L8_9CYAN|nr:(2Fe-2S) ferredoxin domain-containing protein [Aetokthonos hydrillicola]MBO3460851.1 (2Fe-2S) ferredoxin domain-containing protein [Aetokthonos hydrillicola CCALA 1050]MBW4585644.1 (2Fe-2S) ferredoxin domain-containing protein [Aetokthonos hydrillicola CCALA 1050]MDR9894544.1 (2Fe-2S) ferredoxin domain-containing protein [Aetokthonos hydrillicola Thurmond2011]
MSKSYKAEVSEFCVEGQLIDFVIKDGYKLKGLVLATAEGEFYVKLAKHLRVAFDLRTPPGTSLQVIGEKKENPTTGEVKLIAEKVMAARRESALENSSNTSSLMPHGSDVSVSSSSRVKEKPTKSTILVCQKSDCIKRGAQDVCQALQAELSDRNLNSQVNIKATGCMKNCKAGPNLVMPDKTRYSRLATKQVPGLINKHFSDKSPQEKQGLQVLQKSSP